MSYCQYNRSLYLFVIIRNINDKAIYSNNFFDTCLGVVPKMKSLESSTLEIWNYLNNGSFSLRMGAHNTFARIAMDQAIEEKANKNTQTPTRTVWNQVKGCSLKLGCSGMLLYYCRLQTDNVMFFECLEKW